ncbi:NAD(P)H-quinone oxidoreductase [Alicyclobacillus tolerans]|uniref:PIG3 family NAD(P)H quinone oxidoreductase n=2 Tax=Alicyclobacillus tolerans TaxID=90970 RepID=A0ABT9LWE7_9BACL|nr:MULTISPECIES: NAD(P)H-quinone oxidoreductase [Alicyclobacillus]MDP9728602.1 putative PIG3 family NAD(P)H quinone oxidoreductase [Alicyclobacillus tengchongensis]SHJ76718.1 putative NAD(P)H quinone oxidoreductase, PIG3 family [Alicyclobacillus montanus]
MRAVRQDTFGDADVLYIGEASTPTIGSHDLLVRVHATALNRADLLQRRGFYPPPPGESEILGLEMAGEVVEVGADVEGFTLGSRVAALLPGGGYAEYVKIPAGMAMPLPDSMSYEQGAAIPEAFLTAYLNLFWLGKVRKENTVLVHAGASGVGTSALQLIREVGAIALVTAGSAEKISVCKKLGAVAGWNYKEGPFLPFVQKETDGRGVDIILDFIGANYFAENIQSLAVDGRLIVIGTMGGTQVQQLDLGYLLQRRLQIIGTALRSRSVSEKIRLTREFYQFARDGLNEGRIAPLVDTVFDWTEVAKAHAYMESNQNMGKIVLRVSG